VKSVSEPPTSDPTRLGKDQDQLVAADLAAVFEHAMTMSSEMERKWTKALHLAACEDVHEDLRTRWAITLQALTAAVSEREVKLVDEGIDPKHYKWPLDANDAVELEIDPEEIDARRVQLENAQLLALELLVKAVGPLSEAITESQVDANTSWWEAGAFSLVRFSGTLALRITRELDAVDEAQFGEAPSRMETMRARAFDAMGSANEALTRSDPEAALLHCLRATRARIASLTLDGTSAPEFSEITPSATAHLPVRMLALAEKLVAREAVGEPVDTGVALVLANALVPEVERLVTNPPVDELIGIVGSWAQDKSPE
jgi:hypothetical protein